MGMSRQPPRAGLRWFFHVNYCWWWKKSGEYNHLGCTKNASDILGILIKPTSTWWWVYRISEPSHSMVKWWRCVVKWWRCRRKVKGIYIICSKQLGHMTTSRWQGWAKYPDASKWVHPRNLTWNLKISPWKRKVHLETIIFRFHVKFRGCMYQMYSNDITWLMSFSFEVTHTFEQLNIFISEGIYYQKSDTLRLRVFHQLAILGYNLGPGRPRCARLAQVIQVSRWAPAPTIGCI